MEDRVQALSRWALASFASLPVAGLCYVLGRLQANRMIVAGEGWEMAFYWSPLVFSTVDALLVLGGVLGVAGLVAGPRMTQQLQAATAVLVCLGSWHALPWH